MPYVLRNEVSGEIAASVQRNVYDLDYYGAEWFATEEEAVSAARQRSSWRPLRVDESRLKLMNVKLNNDRNRKLFMDDNGTLQVERGSAN